MKNITYLFSTIFCLFFNLNSKAQTPQIRFGKPGIYPEGVTFNSRDNLFYVSSVTTGTIGTVDMKGVYKPLYEDPALKFIVGLCFRCQLQQTFGRFDT
jgi:hypothetical protein